MTEHDTKLSAQARSDLWRSIHGYVEAVANGYVHADQAYKLRQLIDDLITHYGQAVRLEAREIVSKEIMEAVAQRILEPK